MLAILTECRKINTIIIPSYLSVSTLHANKLSLVRGKHFVALFGMCLMLNRKQ